MKKILVLSLVLVLILGISATAYASTADSDVVSTVREIAGKFRNGIGMIKGTEFFEKELLDEFKDLTSEEQTKLLEEKLANEEITEVQYDRLKLMIENGCTFDPELDREGMRAQNGIGMKNGIKFFDKELLDEFKDLTSEEQLSLLEEKLANEEITEVQYDRIKLMIENGCTFDPELDREGMRGQKGSKMGKSMKNGKDMRKGGGNRFNSELRISNEEVGEDI